MGSLVSMAATPSNVTPPGAPGAPALSEMARRKLQQALAVAQLRQRAGSGMAAPNTISPMGVGNPYTPGMTAQMPGLQVGGGH
ncbi:MAG TPA: hypothetical protein VNM39_11985 [Verrucomicrobiae bacterium]|nr:hypothetical protein [Verrucomicrobiae bacterium]